MDAVKFIKERNRMCESFGAGCIGCPAYNESRCVVSSASTLDAKEQVAMVEDWSAAHPRKTRQDVFLEHWPEAELVNGCLAICPKRISANYRNGNADCTNRSCADCLYKFWMHEVE
jgi:hypothetical protein